MESLVSIIGTTGFPIAVCVYLLYERSRSTKDLTKAINHLITLIKSRVK